MAQIIVPFMYCTGIRKPLFSAARLVGSWDSAGRYTSHWSSSSMRVLQHSPDGCASYAAQVSFDPQEVGKAFRWGVHLTTPANGERWGIWREEHPPDATQTVCEFVLERADGGRPHPSQEFILSHARRLGAQKHRRTPTDPDPAIQFSVWAPDARSVKVVLGNVWNASDPARPSLLSWNGSGAPLMSPAPREAIHGGYIADDGLDGRFAGLQPIDLRQTDGVWESDLSDPRLQSFACFDHVPYVFLIEDAGGKVHVRTDLYSRCQLGSGDHKPNGSYHGSVLELDGTRGCSVVVDPDRVTRDFSEPTWPERHWVSQEAFFSGSAADPARPSKPADLVIYELHLGALLNGSGGPNRPGTLADAMAFLDHLVDLGVNCLELLPLSEYGGESGTWGYSTSHYFAIEYSGGGRDQFKWLIRECHRRGISVLADVVYNHYAHDADRAQWMYSSDSHEANSYYWYEGRATDYGRPDGGYVNNVSTGWAPRYWERRVRDLFISSAIALATEFEIDGFRVDQTTSIHSYNTLNADGRALAHVNAYGCKLLRELTAALRLVKPEIMLFAEDHSNWSGVTASTDQGGLGFNATWYADFYHQLIGDADHGPSYARLLQQAGLGDDRPLAMDLFAAVLARTSERTVVYHESHDEAGNGAGTSRTISVAVNGAPLIGETRRFAEARCRVAVALTMFSPGVPMFLFGEEVALARPFLYHRVLEEREDLEALRTGTGQAMFQFYSDVVRLRLSHASLRSGSLAVVYVHNDHRLLLFRRIDARQDLLIVASLNNQAFDRPDYGFTSDALPDGGWREIFNSDAAIYGGANVGNAGAVVWSSGGRLACTVPANGVLVFQRV